MIQFDFEARNGARLSAHYTIESGKLIVSYREETASAAAGVNEIANAFLRDNLMRSILGELIRRKRQRPMMRACRVQARHSFAL
jgi:hypothetical protein